MAFRPEQIGRLRRDDWDTFYSLISFEDAEKRGHFKVPNIQAFAEEVWAALQADGPVVITSGLVLDNSDNQAQTPLTVKKYGTPETTVNITDGDNTIDIDGDTITVGDVIEENTQITVSGGGGGGSTSTVPCKITGGGPGTSYTADLYGDGPGNPATDSVTVTQLSIDASDTIPADTWTFATQIGEDWYIQVPVWL